MTYVQNVNVEFRMDLYMSSFKIVRSIPTTVGSFTAVLEDSGAYPTQGLSFFHRFRSGFLNPKLLLVYFCCPEFYFTQFG